MGLLFDPDALKGIPLQDAERLKAKIDWLWRHRLGIQHAPLKENLAGLYKRRIGKYRIVYSWEPNPDDMVIRLVGPRDDIYKRASG